VERNTYKGILRLSIRRKFHNLCINMKLYQIDLQSPETVDIFRKNLESDPHNPNIVDIIPSREVLDEIFYLIDCERIIDYIQSLPDTSQNNIQVSLGDNLICTLESNQLRRVYNFFNSFASNFALLDSVFKIYINILGEKETLVPVVTLEKPVEEVLETPVVSIPIQSADLAAKSEIEYILDSYCINNTFRSFVIQHILNHLRYISSSIKIENNNVITIPIIFDPFYYSLNYDYILSLFNNTFIEIDESIISFNQKKILENIVVLLDKGQDSESDLTIAVLLFIFYCYQYRSIVSKFPDFEFENYFSHVTQQAGINFFIKKWEPSKDFSVVILESFEEQEDAKSVEDISAKYKHLIPVSEIDFLDLAISEYKSSTKSIQDFQISHAKILDVNLLMTHNTSISKILTQPSMIDTSVYNSRSCASTLINFEQKIITKTYNYFKEYISNPTILLNTTTNIIPKQISNLFDFFSRNFQKIFNNSTNNNILSYYNILLKNLPSPKNYNHNTYLFLIYNLVVPYHYDTFKISKFEDVFL